MILSTHFIISLILAALLYPVFGVKSLLVFLGGFFIDIDHFFWNMIKFRNLNIFEAYEFHNKNIKNNDFTNVTGILLIFHTLEFLLLMLFLSFISEIFLLVTYGLILHLLLDGMHIASLKKGIIAQPSLIFWLIKRYRVSKSSNYLQN